MTVHAEISVIPISQKGGTSMSREIAAAFDAIRKTGGVKATLTALGTQVEAQDVDSVLSAIKAAHAAVINAGAARVISSIRIDERLDRHQTLEEKVSSVKRELGQD